VFVEPNFIYCPALPAGSVVIDAGCSHEADSSVGLIQRHGVRAFGVDPTDKHRDALRRLEAEYPARFTHVPCAIAASDGILTFHESRANESGSLLSDHVNVIHDETTIYNVEAITLPTLPKLGIDRVAILKLDLEGAEYALLEAVTADDLRPFSQVFVEFHHHAVSHYSDADTRRVVARLAGFGFRTFSLDDHNYLFHRAS
jgi:FkbM family methyltransferase